MKRSTIATLILLGGCSAADIVDEPAAEQSQPVVSTYTAVNGVVNVPNNTTSFCHATYFGGSGAHSQAANLGWGIYSYGGLSTQNSNTISAVPNSGHSPPQAGTMAVQVQCDDFANFHGGPGSKGGPYGFSWGTATTIQQVSGSSLLWDGYSACWLDGLGSMSNTAEEAFVDVVWNGAGPGWQWRINVLGQKALSGSARCAWLGRNLGSPVWLSATPGAPAVSSFPVATAACFIHHVRGNIDDGWVWMRNMYGLWGLEVGGAVYSAEGYCVAY